MNSLVPAYILAADGVLKHVGAAPKDCTDGVYEYLGTRILSSAAVDKYRGVYTSMSSGDTKMCIVYYLDERREL